MIERVNMATLKKMDGGPSNLIVALTVVFVALKLTGYIGWSWWWVTAPLWATACFIITYNVAIDMKASKR